MLLMIDGVSSDPFSANTLPPLFDEYRSHSTERVIKVSRERYANDRKSIEDKESIKASSHVTQLSLKKSHIEINPTLSLLTLT